MTEKNNGKISTIAIVQDYLDFLGCSEKEIIEICDNPEYLEFVRKIIFREHPKKSHSIKDPILLRILRKISPSKGEL